MGTVLFNKSVKTPKEDNSANCCECGLYSSRAT